MFFIEKPYISDFFKKTLRDHGIPVVATAAAKKIGLLSGTRLIAEERAIAMLRDDDDLALYSTSENTLGWFARHLSGSELAQKVDLFKDKLKFRELTQPLFPDLFFRGIGVSDLEGLERGQFPYPCIVKPSVGFFSMGVHKVSSPHDWGPCVVSILAEIEAVRGLYPEEVLDTSFFIIEQCIEGDEFAIDAYYDRNGAAVVVGIFQHIFSSASDVSDRIYITSHEIITANREEFTDFAEKIGRVAGVKNFPVHIELRRDGNGTLLPIEVNPLRFGGWCSTADMTAMAYGVNPYLCYYRRRRPDWMQALKGKEGKIFALIILDNSTGREASEILSFDYEALLSRFERPMELRKIDYKEYPVFAFLFTEIRAGNFSELKAILDSDLSEFITCR